MEFKTSEIIKHPRDMVYSTYRDHLTELVPYLPNVETITTLKREETPRGVQLVNQWKISSAIPRAIRPFFPDKMMSYLDRANWNDEALCVDWVFEVGLFPEAVDCHGTNFFIEGKAPGTTEVALGGCLNIDLLKVRGIPRFLKGLAPTIENALLTQVRPNLIAVCQAVGRHLDNLPRVG